MNSYALHKKFGGWGVKGSNLCLLVIMRKTVKGKKNNGKIKNQLYVSLGNLIHFLEIDSFENYLRRNNGNKGLLLLLFFVFLFTLIKIYPLMYFHSFFHLTVQQPQIQSQVLYH